METGELVVDSLAGKFKFMVLEFTRDVEEDLDLIAQGEAEYKAVISCVHDQLKQKLSTLHVSAMPKHPYPECGKALHRIQGKSSYFWRCSEFKGGSKASYGNKNGEPDIEHAK